MRICRIMYEMPPPWTVKAPLPYDLTSVQLKKGDSVDIFCGRWPTAGALLKIKGAVYHTIFSEIIPGTMLYTSAIALLVDYCIWRKFNKPDILHVHGPFATWILFYRTLLAKFLPWHSELTVPVVSHLQETVGNSLYNKLAVQTSSVILFNTEEARQHAVKTYKADLRRCYVIEDGINTDLFVPVSDQEQEKSRKELNLDQFDKVVLYHGTIDETKNINMLVETMALLSENYKLLLVGPADPVYLQKLNAFVHIKALDNRVIKVGLTPYVQVPIAYQVADVFILPIHIAAPSKTILQGLACNIPCLVSGFRLNDAIQGLHYLDDLSPAHFAEQIQQNIENHDGVDVGKVRRKYSWDERIKIIDSLYDFAKKNTLI
jgi:glycosyltransferase involved in cell wall biosynthesis